MCKKYVAIMAGGIGSRYWPASRVQRPKQFLDILGTGESLLQSTYRRFLKICDQENIYILTNEDYIDLVKEQIPGIHEDQILAEPARKNTAPCIAYASYKIFNADPEANIIVSPSDHVITNEDEFVTIVNKAFDFTEENDALCTLGIMPTRPDAGYGYIQFLENVIQDGVYKVKTFTEKPDKLTAQRFIDSGDFLWNAGIFVWKAKNIIKSFRKNLQEVSDAFDEFKPFIGTEKEKLAVEKAFTQCSNISIDFGIMEKADNVYVLPSNFGWSDLGTWTSLYEEKEKDYLNNVVNGKSVVVYDSTNNIIHAPHNKLVVVEGLHNYIVVDTEDVLLICNKDNEQKIKDITHDIKSQKGWGKFL